MDYLVRFWNSPVGPKTTHFWGPVMNWGFAVQGWVDRHRPPEKISRDFQMTLCTYSAIFMRFALRVKPTNYLLFAMHLSNFILQGRLLLIRLNWEKSHPEEAAAQANAKSLAQAAPPSSTDNSKKS